jgi:hypothetical protein
MSRAEAVVAARDVRAAALAGLVHGGARRAFADRAARVRGRFGVVERVDVVAANAFFDDASAAVIRVIDDRAILRRVARTLGCGSRVAPARDLRLRVRAAVDFRLLAAARADDHEHENDSREGFRLLHLNRELA